MELKSNFKIHKKPNKTGEFFLEIGELKKGTSKKAVVTFLSGTKVSNPFATVSCSSCTKASISQNEDFSFDVEITYTGKSLGVINKNVRVYFEKNSKKILYTLTIIGDVKR